MKIAIDAGHGINTAGKRTPDGEREWSFNNKVAVATINRLKEYENVEILRTDDPTGATDVSLAERVRKANAWGADIFVSEHHNANTGNWGTWTGIETFVYTSRPANSVKLANAIHPGVVKAYGLKDRGIKDANYAVLRDTNMAAILIEGGFMDSTIDIKKLRDDNVLKQAGINIADGIAVFGGLKKKAAGVTHTVVAGDTLWALSVKYGVTVDNIKALNGLKDNIISIGQVLKIK